MAAAGKRVKNSYLPITGKLGATVGMGAFSLIAYKITQNNISSNRSKHKCG